MAEPCPVNPRPMREWVRERAASDEACRPCLLTPILPWYRDTLKERGYAELAARVDALGEQQDLDPLQVATVLDEAKAGVDPETACTLAQYDSMAQDAEKELATRKTQS